VVLAGVGVEVVWAPVMGAVDLDGELAFGPVEVDFEAEEVGVDQRLVVNEREEGVFGGASGSGAAASVEGDGLVEHVEVAAPRARVIESRVAAST
jgi:hypothetical protein